MTETTTGGTRTQPTRPSEARIVAGLTASFRKEMLTDAFAYRPLLPLPTPAPAATAPTGHRPPPWRSGQLAWAPHVIVAGAALTTLALAYVFGGFSLSPVGWALTGLVPAAVVLTTLVRPVGAWWLSVCSTTVLAALVGDGWTWPWTPATFFAHLSVMVVVALRTNQRVAGWMWFLTIVLGASLDFFAGSGRPVNTAGMGIVSGMALLIVSVLHIRREADQEVTAQQVVTAVERDRRTLLEERTTIARELHDVVAHHMSVVAIQAEAAPYRVENPPPELEAAFATIRENAVAALTELRRVLGVVRSADYEAPDAPQPTLASLDGLLANVREAGLQVDKTVTGAVRELPQGVELSAYRIVQEALSNTLRHAPGAGAGVEVSYVLGGLGLRIHNAAPTADVRPSPGAGHGITGMRERVAMLQGEMTTGPTDDGGYEVAVFIPVRTTAGERESA
ncbi:sensor histidine kinase [Streptomyces sp. NBC_00239]|uniref:sensor histidine kinase n=1 Tax=Streptomyces sp. NBC_00239 TaxID=2903640 RepID=UPI003FA7228E